MFRVLIFHESFLQLSYAFLFLPTLFVRPVSYRFLPFSCPCPPFLFCVLLIHGSFLAVISFRFLCVVCCVLFVVCCLSFVVSCLKFAVRLFVGSCLIFVVCSLVLYVGCVLWQVSLLLMPLLRADI